MNWHKILLIDRNPVLRQHKYSHIHRQRDIHSHKTIKKKKSEYEMFSRSGSVRYFVSRPSFIL